MSIDICPDYGDIVSELTKENEELQARIAELEAEKCVLIDQQREVKNILIDKNLHIDSLYEEGYKLQQRIAELTECIGSQMADVYTLKARIAELEAERDDWRKSYMNLWRHINNLPQPPEVQE